MIRLGLDTIGPYISQWRGHSILPYLTFKVSIFCYFNY